MLRCRNEVAADGGAVAVGHHARSEPGFRRVVNHRNLGAEELGSIYEALLEYVPTWDPAPLASTDSGDAAGNARKTTGSYYTPTSLIELPARLRARPGARRRREGAADARTPSVACSR